MRVIEQVRSEIRQAFTDAVNRAVAAGELTGPAPAVLLEVPKEKAHGDFATNLAMVMTRQEKKPPRVIAETVLKHLDKQGTWIEATEIAGPGFINLRLKFGWVHQVLSAIQTEGEAFGRSEHGQGRRILLEYVSANPTGPMVLAMSSGLLLSGGAPGPRILDSSCWSSRWRRSRSYATGVSSAPPPPAPPALLTSSGAPIASSALRIKPQA